MPRGKLPQAVSSLFAELPSLPAQLRTGAAKLSPPVSSSSQASADVGSKRSAPLPPGHRRIARSVDKLPQNRELLVYHTECCEEALLGCIVLTIKTKVADVLQMVRDELDVHDVTSLSRGTSGETLKVPLLQNQGGKLALPMFPSERHHLIVTETPDSASDND